MKDLADASGQVIQVEKILEINIERGWRSGTRITFEGEGNERLGHIPGDIIFELEVCRLICNF